MFPIWRRLRHKWEIHRPEAACFRCDVTTGWKIRDFQTGSAITEKMLIFLFSTTEHYSVAISARKTGRFRAGYVRRSERSGAEGFSVRSSHGRGVLRYTNRRKPWNVKRGRAGIALAAFDLSTPLCRPKPDRSGSRALQSPIAKLLIIWLLRPPPASERIGGIEGKRERSIRTDKSVPPYFSDLSFEL